MSNTFLFGEDLREKVTQDIKLSQLKSERLNAHKESILKIQQQKISLYSLQQAINLIAFYMQQVTIEQMSETELVKLYIKILIKIKSQLKKSRSTFKVDFEELGEIDSDEFLSDLDKYVYKEMELLSEWDKFMISMRLYFIQYRHLNSLLKESNLIDKEMPISDKKERILEAKSIIRRIISNFTEDDLLVFENKSRGHKGFKNAVFEKLTISEYRKYFESNKTNFKNRWDEVRRENSHQNSRHK
ncbi:hypothetical protein SKM54_09490 [Acinetobacter faecalis]|uniref:hypothetical protein n=2 Tax=Acinetobacter faecalis TaxID=2665161 RepID=UPI002A91485A|nr:hypothetical protein [Acinetobacter faecalis]MDY6482675.1 hypothetical protein [Acinetobacter faecalis]